MSGIDQETQCNTSYLVFFRAFPTLRAALSASITAARRKTRRFPLFRLAQTLIADSGHRCTASCPSNHLRAPLPDRYPSAHKPAKGYSVKT